MMLGATSYGLSSALLSRVIRPFPARRSSDLLEVRIAGQRHCAGAAVDAEGARVGAAQAVTGRTRGNVARVGRGGGVDHLARAAVLVNRCRRGARGDARR